MPIKQNVLQYEFFHGDRALQPITVIRIYDIENWVTVMAIQAKTLEEHYIELLYQGDGLASTLAMWAKVWWISRRLRRFRRTLFMYAISYLNRAIKEPLAVVVEKDDRYFEEVQCEEIPHILQLVNQTTDLRLSVFEPKSLLAKTNRQVISLM